RGRGSYHNGRPGNNASVPFSLLCPDHLLACDASSRNGESAENRMIRRPAVAGQFYPADPERLRSELIASTHGGAASSRPRAVAILVPQPGYRYSGTIAGPTYASVRRAPRAVVLCPNHTGRGEAIALDDSSWQTP